MAAVTRRRWARPHDGRLVAGVGVGVARALGIDASVVRFAFMMLALAGGVGVVVYGVLWMVLPETDEPAVAEPTDWWANVAVLAVVAGALLVLRAAGLWFSDVVTLVGGIGAVGVALVWGRADSPRRSVEDRGAALRLAVGGVLVVTGFVAFVALTGDLQGLGQSLIAVAVAVAGLALLLGPRLARVADDLRAERMARARSEERADIAAHLHDGVLQTLALIQRRADDSREVAALARRQERELRDWLYGQGPAPDATLDRELAAAMATVEDDHQVRIEVVCVGDAPLDEPAAVVVAATREAATNAARHGEVARVDVFVEVEDERISAFVRDRGKGFDPATVPADRRGLADSVVGRVTRAGGTATVRSAPGEGTEVVIEVPRSAS